MSEFWKDFRVQLAVAIASAAIIAMCAAAWPKLRKGWRLHRMRRSGEPLVLVVSAGGTCRDPMAKAITDKLLAMNGITGIRIEGRGLQPGANAARVSYAARAAIKEMFHEDLLADYVPERLTPSDIEAADLILVMAKNLIYKDVLPAGKTYLLKEFFGAHGDVRDPFPDGRDEETLERYRACAEDLRATIEPGLRRLVAATTIT